MKYLIHLAYKGTAYRGWQRQAKVLTVQQVLEEAMKKVLKQPISVMGCGRTDAGVHACQFFGQFSREAGLPPDFVFVLNQVLPQDIRVYDVLPVPPDANVQLDAQSRTYRYYFHNLENPFLAEQSTYVPIEDFDLKSVKTCLKLLPKQKDFRAFCKTPDRHKHTMVQVQKANIIQVSPHQFYLEFTANRFLKGMVRALVHALLQVGQGKLSTDSFARRLQAALMAPNIQLAYPQGLFLWKVLYGYLELETRVFN